MSVGDRISIYIRQIANSIDHQWFHVMELFGFNTRDE